MGSFRQGLMGLMLVGSLFGAVVPAPAQNMGGTVVEKRVRFARGTHGATVPGRAKYGMSYVYKFGAGKGNENMNALLQSNGNAVTFSIVGPNDETLPGAFNVTTWSGTLPRAGDYSIVVVMNNKGAGTVPFTLDVTIR